MIKKFNTKIVGVTFNNIQTYLPKIKINDQLQAVFEPDNIYDHNAVAIYHNQNKIGYFPKNIAKTLKPIYDINIITTAITGGGKNESYGCNILVTVDDHIKSIEKKNNILDEILSL